MVKCRKCGKEAVGIIKRVRITSHGILFPHFYDTFEGVCEKHLKEEEKRLKKL